MVPQFYSVVPQVDAIDEAQLGASAKQAAAESDRLIAHLQAGHMHQTFTAHKNTYTHTISRAPGRLGLVLRLFAILRLRTQKQLHTVTPTLTCARTYMLIVAPLPGCHQLGHLHICRPR